MQGIARAPGTCGELLQGKVEGTNFLVTCPVDIYSVVKVQLNNTGIVKTDPGMTKVGLAVQKTLRLLGSEPLGADVLVTSAIPCGKGMASSTADISAASAATAAALGVRISPESIAGIALEIEPTDGLMFPGITQFDHVEGKICRVIGPAPDLEMLIVDLGGTVDTVEFNANLELDILNKRKEHRISLALEKLEAGITSGNMQLIGEAATESAFANQTILFKSELEILVDLCKRAGGLGVNVAHSGTVIGLIFDSGRNIRKNALKLLADEGFNTIYTASLISGGVEVLEERAGGRVWQSLNAYMEETCGRLRKSTG